MKQLSTFLERLNLTEESHVTSTQDSKEQVNNSERELDGLLNLLAAQLEVVENQSSVFFIGIKTNSQEEAINSLMTSYLNKCEAVLNSIDILLLQKKELGVSDALLLEIKLLQKKFALSLSGIFKQAIIYLNQRNNEALFLREIGIFQEQYKTLSTLGRSNKLAFRKLNIKALDLVSDSIQEFASFLTSAQNNFMIIDGEIDEELTEFEAELIEKHIVSLHTSSEILTKVSETTSESVPAINMVTQLLIEFELKLTDLGAELYPPMLNNEKNTEEMSHFKVKVATLAKEVILILDNIMTAFDISYSRDNNYFIYF